MDIEVKRKIKACLGGHVDLISFTKTGTVKVYSEFYYRFGNDENTFRKKVEKILNDVNIKYTIVDYGEHWAPFSGGAGVRASSHWYVEFKVD